MASTLFVTEFEFISDQFPAAQQPPVAEQTVAIGVGSVQSAAFNADTTYIRVCADAACSIEIGANPTADATKMFLPANIPEYFGVAKGAGWKIATITNS